MLFLYLLSGLMLQKSPHFAHIVFLHISFKFDSKQPLFFKQIN